MSSIEFTKIAVFYDGNFFSHVSNYYQFHHRRHARISISGLHEFIRQEVSRTDGTDVRYCQMVDAHYFRGRLRTSDADQRDILVKERLFDDVLLREGVTTHYLPLAPSGEKGIDVWMALEAYELALLKHYEVCVLVASDGDFLPLVRKLNSVGTRVMVLGWDFRYTNRDGIERETKTAQILLREATYPVMMSDRIEHGFGSNDPIINALFIPVGEMRFRQHGLRSPQTMRAVDTPIHADAAHEAEHGTSSLFEVYSLDDFTGRTPLFPADETPEASKDRVTGRIQFLKEGFGFIAPDTGGENIYFYHVDLQNVLFLELAVNDRVEYTNGENSKGRCALEICLLG